MKSKVKIVTAALGAEIWEIRKNINIYFAISRSGEDR